MAADVEGGVVRGVGRWAGGVARVALPLLVAISGAVGVALPQSAQAAAGPPTPIGALSRKTHGAVAFDLVLSLDPASPTVEPRQSATATLVVRFDKPVSAASAAVTEGAASAGAPAIAGNDVVVGLTGVANAQWVTLTLTDVASTDGGTGGTAAVRLGVLAGDVSQNRVVTVSDLAQVNAQIAQVVGVANYLKDVNASGTLTVADKGLANAQITRALPALANQAPAVSAGADQWVTLPATATLAGSVSDDDRPAPAPTLHWAKLSGPGIVAFADAASAATTASFSVPGLYVLGLTASDGSLVAGDRVQVLVDGATAPPLLAPPAVEPAVTTTPAAATAFLYTGPNAVQQGVAPGTIVPRRAVVVRGRVSDRNGDPLPGVVVTVLGHPEFGYTQSRADGAFDLAVNGGGRLTLDFQRPGFLPAQRQIDVPWQDYVAVPALRLVPLDPQATQVDLTSAAPIQVARGSVVTDADGTRRATVLFPQGLTAQMRLADGSVRPLSTLSFRATEYTVGPEGPQAMPGVLPPSSMYTYAVELSADEALAAGATSVQFDRPLPTYVENFLGFPVGTPVPAGYYDRARAEWVPSADGRVVAILGASGGLADVDADGNGLADDAAALAALGITAAERAMLATLYSPGQTLWRVPVTHFTPWDCNWPYGPPADAQSPADAGANVAVQDQDLDGSCQAQGSLVDCQNRALGEVLAIAGAPYRLVYWSNRTPGASRGLDITASGATVPASLRSIDVQVSVAGQTSVQSFPAAPNKGFSFQWDGRDGYGRRMHGGQVASVEIRYDYPAEYKAPGGFAQSFGRYGGNTVVVGNRQGATVGLVTRYRALLGSGLTDARDPGLGGWTLDVHHFYDPAARELHLGDGRRRKADALGRVIDRVATAKAPTGGSSNVNSIAIAPDGSVYYIDSISDPTVVRRVAPDGTDTVFAGGGKRNPTPPPPYGENGPAIGATLFNPSGLAFGADGSLYIQDSVVILRVGRDGIIRRIAGKDRLSPPHSGCPGATLTQGSVAAAINLCMQAFTIAPDGTIYFVELRSSPYTSESAYVMRIGLDGLVYRFAGNGAACPTSGSSTCGDGGPALAASFTSEFGGSLAVAPDGSVFIGDASSIRRVGIDGIITTIAGKRRQQGFSGDGGKARDALFCSATNFAVAPDGALWLNDRMNHRLRRIDTDGTVATIAGSGPACDFSPPISSGDGGPALRASMQNPLSVAIAPNGDAYVLDASGGTPRSIRRIAPTLPGIEDAEFLVPSADGGAIYEFAASGRHLRTRHALTGAVLREFGYGADGRLARVTEKTGATDNVTTIEHDASGHPLAIVGPYGQRTTLAVDANGFLASVTNPAGETHQLESTPTGLLTAYTDPRGNASSYAYDARGRLASATDPSGGSQALAWSKVGGKTRVTRTTALGRTSAIENEDLASGAHRRTVSFADGTAQVEEDLADAGIGRLTGADAVVTDVALAPDPRFGMPGAFPKSVAAAFPSGLSVVASATQAATLADPADPLSLQSLVSTATISGRMLSTTFTRATKTAVTTSPAGRTSSVSVDELGRLVAAQAPGHGSVSATLDARGRLATLTRSDGNEARTTTFAYDATGQLAAVTDPLGRTVQYVHDAAGRVQGKVFADGRTLGIGYDAAGNVTSVTPPSRPAWQLAYSARDELVQVTPPAAPGSGPATFAYNLDRQPAALVRGDGRGASLAYDSGGRRASRSLTTGGAPTSTDTYAYDAAGRLSGIVAASGVSLDYQWDGSLPTRITWSGVVSGNVAFTYDDGLRLASEAANGGNAVAFAYDADDLPTSAGAATILRHAASGLPTAISVANATTVLAYNGFGEVASATTSVAGNVLLALAYTRDKLGRITRTVETVGGTTTTWDYAYAASGQLASVARNGTAAEQYAYDGHGNRTNANVGGSAAAATFDAQDRLLASGATTFAHNAAGALQSRTLGGQTTTYQYDPLGNLLSVVPPAGSAVSYLVDGRGRRVAKKVGGSVVQQFLYAGALRVAAELDGAGNLVSRFVYGGGRVPLYMTRAGTTYLLATDAVGSVRLVVDAQTGAIAQRIDYDAFGNVVLDTHPGVQPFGFAGGLHDPDTGLVRMGARDYDAHTGRWTTPDPRGLGGLDTNLYRYAANDPVNLVDPTGASAWDTAVGFVQQGQVEAYALMSPAVGLSILADSLNRMLQEGAGYAVPQASLEDAMAGRAYPSPLVDYASEDYAKGAFAAACVGFVAGIAEGNPGALDKARTLLRALGTKLDDALTRLLSKPETLQTVAKPDLLGDLLKRTIKDVGGSEAKLEQVLGEQRGSTSRGR